MSTYEQAMQVLSELFAKDYQFSLATSQNDVPTLRVVDAFYDDGAFWIVTYDLSHKVQDIMKNQNVAMCSYLYSFSGRATNEGSPLKPENQEIRSKLIKVFESWYFAHNNENDEHMCYVKVELASGFFCKDGTAYKVDFENKTANSFPFEPDVKVLN